MPVARLAFCAHRLLTYRSKPSHSTPSLRMSRTADWRTLAATLVFFGGMAGASRILHVAQGGDDANDGLTPATAFRSIGRAAAIADPGDVVTVAGGTYREAVTLARPGRPEAPILFRAAPRETAVVTAGIRVEGWRKEPGTRRTWSAECPSLPAAVWEDRTVTRYMELENPAAVDDAPGSYRYDRTLRRLTVHALRSLPPDQAGIIAVPASGATRHGFSIAAANTAVEGFVIAYHPWSGISIDADGGAARNNTVYGCVEGITVQGGDGVAVLRNRCFRNDVQGLILRGGGAVLLQENRAWDNGPAGPFLDSFGALPMNLSIYGFDGYARLVGNTAIVRQGGGRGGAWRYKGVRSPARITTQGNVIVTQGTSCEVQWGAAADHSGNTVIGGPMRIYESDHRVLTEDLAREHGARAESNLYVTGIVREEDGFADPLRHDYRLRQDSPHLARGAFPQPAPVRYVSPEGDDAHDGRTPTTAWRTPGHAAARAQPGDTVYLLPGTYPGPVLFARSGFAERPIRFLSYGCADVILDGGTDAAAELRNVDHVVIEGLTFTSGGDACVRIEASRHITLRRCVLSGGARGLAVGGASDLALLNNTFSGCRFGLEATSGTERLLLRNNLFAGNAAIPRLAGDTARDLVSECNGFAGPRAGEQLLEWQALIRENHPSLSETTAPRPAWSIPPHSRLGFGGLGHEPIGAHPALPDKTPIVIANFRIASKLPDQAVLAWQTPHDYPDARIVWTDPESTQGELAVAQGERRRMTSGTARIGPLTPGVRYEAVLNVSTPDGRRATAEVSFATPLRARAPTVLHVAPDGSDENDGQTPQSPFRTLNAASLAAVPGDTVLVAPGVYPETLQIACGGISPEQRLTFRSVQPGAAVMDCESIRIHAIRADRVRHLAIDGFRFTRLVSSGSIGTVEIQDVEDFVFVNNVFDPIGRIASNRLLLAWRSRGLDIRNNLFNRGFYGISTVDCRDVTIDHNTFYATSVTAIQLGGKNETQPAEARIVNNIFMDAVSPKKASPAVCICYPPSPSLVCDYNLYGRERSPAMALFGYRWTPDGQRIGWGSGNALTLAELRRDFGVGGHSQLTGQIFADPERGDFRLPADSPAIAMGSDGTTVGWQAGRVQRQAPRPAGPHPFQTTGGTRP